MKPLPTRTAAVLGTAAAALSVAAALGAAPASAATADVTSPNVVHVSPGVVVYPNCGEVFEFTTANTHIRSSWGTSAPIIGLGQPGQDFESKWRTSYTYDGTYWAKGVDDSTGVTGYVALSLLKPVSPAYCTVLS